MNPTTLIFKGLAEIAAGSCANLPTKERYERHNIIHVSTTLHEIRTPI